MFCSLSRVLASPGVPPFRLQLALQGNQLTRWFVMDAAYAHGWFLTHEDESFDSRDFPG